MLLLCVLDSLSPLRYPSIRRCRDAAARPSTTTYTACRHDVASCASLPFGVWVMSQTQVCPCDRKHNGGTSTTIWDTIQRDYFTRSINIVKTTDSSNQDGNTTDTMSQPSIFVWTGDAVYPPSRGVASLEELQEEYRQLLTNESLGYASFVQASNKKYIFGTWDDHDYGGNDLGVEMPDKYQRKRLFWENLLLMKNNKDAVSPYRTSTDAAWQRREGLYHAVELGVVPNKTLLVLLDTRWYRQAHCIESVASKIPYVGTGIACLTRWWTAGMDWCAYRTMDGTSSDEDDGALLLGHEQWEWLGELLQDTDASFIVLVSSIQVLTTNPVMESWGQYPVERQKLLRLVNQVLEKNANAQMKNETVDSNTNKSIVLISGDVHHAEILDPLAVGIASSWSTPSKQSFLEITSSGLTHSCEQPFYGAVCKPLLQTFHSHRRDPDAYHVGLNFGGLDLDWATREWRVQVFDRRGSAVLSTGWRSINTMEALTSRELEHVAPCVDGHLRPYVRRLVTALGVIVSVVIFFLLARSGTTTAARKSKQS